MSDEVLTGEICFWSDERAFGFAKRDDGERDIFVHCRDVRDHDGNRYSMLGLGQRLEFRIGQNPGTGRTCATNVILKGSIEKNSQRAVPFRRDATDEGEPE